MINTRRPTNQTFRTSSSSGFTVMRATFIGLIAVTMVVASVSGLNAQDDVIVFDDFGDALTSNVSSFPFLEVNKFRAADSTDAQSITSGLGTTVDRTVTLDRVGTIASSATRSIIEIFGGEFGWSNDNAVQTTFQIDYDFGASIDVTDLGGGKVAQTFQFKVAAVDLSATLAMTLKDSDGTEETVSVSGISPNSTYNIFFDEFTNVDLTSVDEISLAGGGPAAVDMTISRFAMAVPEPLSGIYLCLGASVLCFTRRRKSKLVV